MPNINWRRYFGLRDAGVYYALALMIASMALYTSITGRGDYLTFQNMTNIVYQSSLVGIMAVAMTVVLILGAFDLSVASVAALSGVVTILLSDKIGFVPAACVGVLIGTCVGLFNGSIVEFVGINPFIVTLGALTGLRGLVLAITDGRAVAFDSEDVRSQMVAFEGGRVGLQMPLISIGLLLLLLSLLLIWFAKSRGRSWPATNILRIATAGLALLVMALLAGGEASVAKPVIYMAAVTTVLWFILTFTTVGRRIFAVGSNPEAARLSGINVRAYKIAGFVLSGTIAGFAGLLFASRLGAINPTALQGTELTVIAAAILGGTSLFGGAGSVIKTLAGAFLLYTLNNGFNVLNLGANYQGLVEGLTVIAAAAIYTVGGTKK